MHRIRKEWLLIMSIGLTGCATPNAGEPPIVLDDFRTVSEWRVWPEAWGGKASFEAAPPPAGLPGAIRFTGPGIVYRELTEAGTKDTADAKGLSFRVKGDGSGLYGSIAVGPAGKGSWEQGFVNSGMTANVFYFPLRDTNWHQVTASWDEFVPEGPHPPIGMPGGITPSDIRVLRIGNRWKYWRNYDAYPRFSYDIGPIELVRAITPNRADSGPVPTVEKVLEKMRRGEVVRILCVGDSITAGAGTTPDKRYWVLLESMLRTTFHNDKIVVEGWGIGGATLLDSLPWMEWMLGKEPPDLVTVMFGTNDCSTYPPDFFAWSLAQFIERATLCSGGRTAVLPFATLPGQKEYTTKTDPYADAVRQVAKKAGQPFLDLSAAFKSLDAAAYAACFADGVHLNATGHAFVAQTILKGFTEKAEPARPAPPMPAILKEVRKILFYGDSLTDGSSYPDYVVNTLNGLYPDARFEILNAAGAGDTAANLRKRLAADVLVHKPGLTIVCIGTNDAHGKRKPGDFRADLESVVADLQKAGSRVLLVRPSPFGDAEKEGRFGDYLAVIDSVAASNGLPVADAHGLFLKWAKDGKEPLGADGIHHGQDGFACMARAILDGLGLGGVQLDMAVRPWPNLLTAWETSDPVTNRAPFDPAAARGWKPYDAAALAARLPWWNSPFPQRGAWLPFDDASPKQVAYGRTFFDAPAAGDYELQVGGSPAPQIVWVNGVKVWEGRRSNGYHPNADRVTVALKAGRNDIVAVSNFMIFLGIRRAGG